MSTSFRIPGVVARFSCIAIVLSVIAGTVSAQSGCNNCTAGAPQLLPYTAKVIAGGGNTPATAGSTCSRAGATPSGNTSYDAYGDGCLATEIALSTGSSGPRYAITDSTGAIYFSDYNNGLIRRIDPSTGIVTAIVGGAASNPGASGTSASCGTLDPAHTTLSGDKFADGCLGTAVKLGKPTALVFSLTTGDLYFSDTYNYDVRKMSLSNGGVAAVVLKSGGSGYATPPTVTFSAPASGTTATGTATISGGVVTGVTITNAGSGYTPGTLPTVTFSVSGSGAVASGTAVYTGVMAMAAGSQNGGSTTAKGYSIPCSTTAAPGSSTACLLDAPYGLAFDAAGNLYISEEYYEAILVLNTNTSGSTTVATVSIPAQTLGKVVGARTGGTPCLNGTGTTTTGNSGCNYGNYTTATAATSTSLDAPYGVALDSSNNIYIANEYNNDAAEVFATTGILNNYTGLYPPSSTGVVEPATKRGAAGFTVGSDFGIALDKTNNAYQTDALAGYIWRVDATTNTMFVVGGGGAATTAGTACSAASTQTATDAFGDGCPATLATFSKSGTTQASTGIFGVFPDTTGDLFLGDEGNGLVREIASGTNFGNTGASATDYIDIHFAAGDTPLAASGGNVPFAITGGASIFTLGTPVCTVNNDNNGANTEDCVIPVTASPTVVGPYSGTLTVKSTNVPSGTSFALSGNFAQSPVTRLALTFSNATVSCGNTTTFANTDTVALTATLISNGPTVPNGNVTFYAAANGGAPAQIGNPVNVINSGTSGNPVYSATLNYSFTTPGSYTISATYSGDTTAPKYYLGSSTTDATPLVTVTPTFAIAATSDGTTNVHGGCPPGEIGQCVVTAGQTALYSVTLTDTVYTGNITFACSGAPANASCVIAPTSLTTTECSTTGTLAVSVITSGGVPAQTAIGLPGRGPWSLLTMLLGVGLALMVGLRRRKLHLRGMWMSLALLLTSYGLAGCTSGTVNNLPVTPKGNYTITITATGSAGGVVSSVGLPLTIQ